MGSGAFGLQDVLQGIVTKKNFLKFLQDGTARGLRIELGYLHFQETIKNPGQPLGFEKNDVERMRNQPLEHFDLEGSTLKDLFCGQWRN